MIAAADIAGGCSIRLQYLREKRLSRGANLLIEGYLR